MDRINLMIPEEYYTQTIAVELTQQERDLIIGELERTEHNLFLFLGYDKIIKKLKGERNE